MQLKYDNTDPYYSKLPSGFCQATLDDFYLKNHLIMDKPYLIHSIINPNRYWAKRTKLGFLQHNDFMDFLEMGRIYIYKKIT